MAIHMVPIRARIVVGDSLSVETPYILSFNVTKARGQLSSFSASIKISHQTVSGAITGAGVVIYAGQGSSGLSKKIYTGIIKSANITPCRDDPLYVIMNLTGTDVLSQLQGKKFTRRCRSTKGLWVGIESVTRPGLKSSKFSYLPAEADFETTPIDVTKKDNTTKTMVKNVPENTPKPRESQDLPEVNLEVTPAEK
jgi:hypothetical protein